MYRHIIWDFDGTLFDSYPVMAGVFKELLMENGIHEPLDNINRHMRISMPHAIEHYKNLYQINDAFLLELEQRSKEAELHMCKPYDGIEEVCRYIVATGRYNYLYTHRGESALTLLHRFGLQDTFRDCITSVQGFPRKPSPDAIRYLLDKYGMQPQEALMIGDRILDIQAAVNAGIHTCYFREYDIDVQADHTIENFKELLELI